MDVTRLAEIESFRIGDDPGGPEDLRFDTLVDGRPLRAWLSGFPYYRVG